MPLVVVDRTKRAFPSSLLLQGEIRMKNFADPPIVQTDIPACMQHFPFPASREKGTPKVNDTKGWVYDAGTFNLDYLESIKPTFSKEIST